MNYYEPNTLWGLIRKVHPLTTFMKGRFFKENVTFNTEKVTFEFTEDKRRLAPYVNPYSQSLSMERNGYESRTYTPPYIAPSRIITPETLQNKLPGESPYDSGIDPEERAMQLIAQDLAELQDSIARREEYMCARLKQDGILHFTGAGVSAKVDYGFTNIETCTSGDKWTSSYDIVSKLKSMAQVLYKSGTNPDMLILGIDAASALMDNAKLMKLLDTRRVDAGEIRPERLESGVQYLGRLAVPGCVLDMYIYNEYYYDYVTGSTLPYMDAGSVIMQSSQESNKMLYGAVTYIGEDEEFVSNAAEYVPYVVTTRKPPMRELIVASRPLPMPYDVQSWSVLKEVV